MTSALRRSRLAVAASVCLFSALLISGAALADGLSDPSAAKTANKCQKEIKKGGAKFVGKNLKSLDKCVGGIFKCIQTQADAAKRQKCVDKAGGKCTKELGKIATEKQKYHDSIVGKCGTLSLEDVESAAGVGYENVDFECTGPLSSVADVATCVADYHECKSDPLYTVEQPRAQELMQFANVPAQLIPSSTCLPGAGGAGDDVDDEKGVGKALAKCAKGLAKAGSGFATKKMKSIEKCLDAVFACEQLKQGPDLPACITKATKTCDKAFASVDTAEAKLRAAAQKACGTIDFDTALGADTGLDLVLLGKECPSFGIGTVDSLSSYIDCLFQQHECRVDQLLRYQAPRIEELLASVGRLPRAAFCPGPSPTPTPTPTVTATPTPTVTATQGPVTPTATPNCGDGVLAAGELCDPTAPAPGDVCPNSGNGLETCSMACTCACPSRVDFEGDATDPLSELDPGWTGIAHDARIVSNGKVTVQVTDCPSSPGFTKPCGTCNISGPIDNPAADAGDLNDHRCHDDSSVKCTSNADCTGAGNACIYYFGAPLPLSAGGVATCVSNEIVGTITGTANVETGESASVLTLTSHVFNGLATDTPCPKCTDPGALNDGMASGGTCTGGPRTGMSCDANSESPIPAFGRTSLDCPPAPGGKIADLPIALKNSTGAESRSLSAASPSCSAFGFTGFKCPCDTCDDADATPCASNADCGAGGICGGLRCLVDAPTPGTPCSSEGTGSDSACCSEPTCTTGTIGTCGRPGEPSKPNACSNGQCVSGGGSDDGQCQLAPSDNLCSVETFRSCTTNNDCRPPAEGGTCGNCAPGMQTCTVKRRECLFDLDENPATHDGTITAHGAADAPVDDVSHPTLASMFCIAPTGSSSVNAVAGLPGLGKLKLKGTARGLP